MSCSHSGKFSYLQIQKIFLLVFLLGFLTDSQAQLTQDIQGAFVKMANQEIQKQLVNGSDNKDDDVAAQVETSLRKVVHAGQVLEYLGKKYSAQGTRDVCSWAKQMTTEGISVKATLLKLELVRIYECNVYAKSVLADAQKILDNSEEELRSVGEYYAAYKVAVKSKDNGLAVKKFKGAMEKKF